MNRSPERGTFRLEKETDSDRIELFKSWEQQRLELEETEQWRKDNLEYDLRTNETIIEKCKDHVYAQHIYAALCNNEFQKNDVYPILSDKRWSCSWRHAGGIVADIRQEGDYIDWYCSGIRDTGELEQTEFDMLTEEQKERYLETKAYVSESVVTDEVRKDLFDLGWIVLGDRE
jgi:hypothetical protein